MVKFCIYSFKLSSSLLIFFLINYFQFDILELLFIEENLKTNLYFIAGETQPQVLYVQPPPSQHGFLNLGAENSLSQVRGSKPATNLQSTFATGINQTQPVQQATLQQTHPQQSFQIGQYTNQSTVTSATGNITQEQLAQRQQYFQKFLCQLLSNCGNNIQSRYQFPKKR